MAFNERMRVRVHPSVYDALKYLTQTVTPRTFSKIILSHSFLSYGSFCVNIFSIICATLCHVTVKTLIES